MMLEISPQVLDRIQLWSVSREAFDLEPVAMLADEVGDFPTPVHRQTIPNYQQRPGQLSQETAKKVDHLGAANRAWIEPKVEVPPGYPRDRREGFPVEMELEDRGVAAGRPGSTPVGSFAESALVDEDDGLAKPGSVFFTLGQRRRFQCSMFSSLRSTARPTGRCTLHLRRRRILQTWPGW